MALTQPPHNNQQLFSNHYLDEVLPQRLDWLALASEAQPVLAAITTIFKRYKPNEKEKEAQTEYNFVRLVLQALGHIFEVQPSLAVPHGTQTPDYIFYYEQDSVDRYRGEKLIRS